MICCDAAVALGAGTKKHSYFLGEVPGKDLSNLVNGESLGLSFIESPQVPRNSVEVTHFVGLVYKGPLMLPTVNLT